MAIGANLVGLEELTLDLERVHGEDIAAVHPNHRPDTINLVHYLALRHGDVRLLQRQLGERGLSSLGRCEPHVLATVESVRADIVGGAPRFVPATLSFEKGRAASIATRTPSSVPAPREGCLESW